MLKLAVTGGIACGKSSIGRLMRQSGVDVCEADEIVHRLLKDDDEVRDILVAQMGNGVLDASGLVDRARLADLVFQSSGKLEWLTTLLHPLVRQEWERWLRVIEASGSTSACVIVPLLYEAGMAECWDSVICVTAANDLCITRMKDRGDTHFARRMELQMPVIEKAAKADYVICNNGSERSMSEQWLRIYSTITETNND